MAEPYTLSEIFNLYVTINNLTSLERGDHASTVKGSAWGQLAHSGGVRLIVGGDAVRIVGRALYSFIAWNTGIASSLKRENT